MAVERNENNIDGANYSNVFIALKHLANVALYMLRCLFPYNSCILS